MPPLEEPWLSGYRVLDLTDEKGYFCGWILGSLGADVIKVEPPGGDSARNLGPFFRDTPHPEKSLSWFAYNSNKRSLTLNLECSDGRALFFRLVQKADFIVESFPPGYMDQLGLGYGALCRVNPGLTMVSITHFGQSGPYRNYKGADLVSLALGGLLYVYGYPDRPPVKMSAFQAYPVAAADAAVAALIALHYRTLTGEGQYVDVSIQQSVAMCTFNLLPLWLMTGFVLRRAGEYRTGLGGQVRQRQIWHCQDGELIFLMFGGAYGAKAHRALVEWMRSEGMVDDFLRQVDWDTFDPSKATQELVRCIEGPVGQFFLNHTKAELFEGALKRKIQLAPVCSPRDIVESPQLAARGYWVEVEHPELGTSIIYPGAFVKSSGKGCGIWRRAPLVGEHNQDIYEGELGLSKDQVLSLKMAGMI